MDMNDILNQWDNIQAQKERKQKESGKTKFHIKKQMLQHPKKKHVRPKKILNQKLNLKILKK